MYITSLGFILFALSGIWVFKPVRLLQLALIAAVFEAAAAAVFGDFGLQPPLVPGLLFIFYVCLQYVLGARYPGQWTALRALLPLVALLVYAVVSIGVITNAFAGQVLVWPVRPDLLRQGAVPLEFSFGNITQTLYLAINVMMTLTVAVFITRRSINYASIVRAYLLSGYLVIFLVMWQLANRTVGVPFPDSFLHSNPGWAIVEQSMSFVPRLQGPFSEPSALAVYLCGVIFCSLWLNIRGYRIMRPGLLLGLSVFSVLLSTSTTGIVTTIVGVPVVLGMASKDGARARARIIRTLIYLFIGSVFVLGPLLVLRPDLADGVQVVVEATMSKGETQSYDDRSSMDLEALNTMVDTYGLGAGWGSARSNSLIPGMLANAGMFGLGMALWLVLRVVHLGVRARAAAPGHSGAVMVDGFSAALCGQLAAGLVSEPVITSLAFFLELGCVVGVLSRMLNEPRPRLMRFSTAIPIAARPSRLRADL